MEKVHTLIDRGCALMKEGRSTEDPEFLEIIQELVAEIQRLGPDLLREELKKLPSLLAIDVSAEERLTRDLFFVAVHFTS